MYDFSKVEAPKEVKYLQPGTFTLHPSAVELVEVNGKTPYLNISFSGKEGIVKQKFYLSEKALPNLVYLHEGLFGKTITKAFESNAQLHAYFEKALTTKQIDKVFLVGGTEGDNGKVYCELPYGRFLVKENSDYPDGVFDKDSDAYKGVVRKRELNGSTDLATNSSLLPNSNTDTAAGDDLPW